MPVYAIDDLVPVIKTTSYVHPSAEIIGDVIIDDHCYIGPNAVLRGDFGRIHIHHHSNVQDNCVVHSFPNKDAILKAFSHIGHGAILHGCVIEENSLVGINAVILDEAVIGKESIVAASSFVKAKFTCPERSMVMGTPAKVVKTLTDEEVKWKTSGTGEYTHLTERCLASMRVIEPLTEIQADRPRYLESSHQFK